MLNMERRFEILSLKWEKLKGVISISEFIILRKSGRSQKNYRDFYINESVYNFDTNQTIISPKNKGKIFMKVFTIWYSQIEKSVVE